MSGRFLLDTNIVIALFQGDISVQEKLAKAEQVFVSSTVIGELYYGAYRSGRVTTNLTRLEDFVASNTVLVCDTSFSLDIARNGDSQDYLELVLEE